MGPLLPVEWAVALRLPKASRREAKLTGSSFGCSLSDTWSPLMSRLGLALALLALNRRGVP